MSRKDYILIADMIVDMINNKLLAKTKLDTVIYKFQRQLSSTGNFNYSRFEDYIKDRIK